MRKQFVIVIAATVGAALALTATASAGVPERGSFTAHDQFVDTQTCGFPIVGDFTFTNDNAAFFDSAGTLVRVELHETTTGTLTAKGVTLRESDTENVHVDFVDGSAVLAKHTGSLFHLTGPGGTVFHLAGQLLFEVINSFDGPLIAAHGVDLGGNDATFCAAFA